MKPKTNNLDLWIAIVGILLMTYIIIKTWQMDHYSWDRIFDNLLMSGS